MIVVLLLAAGLVLGGIGFGGYLLVRPDPAESRAADPPPPPAATPSPTSSEPDPGPGPGSGTTTVEPPGDSPDDLRAVARDYVAAVNDRDAAAATGLTCREADPGTLFSVAEGREVTLGEVEVIEGPVASATVRVGDGETALLLENQEDGWCVAI